MKNVMTSLLILSFSGLTVVGCGKYEKNPVKDLDTIRKAGKAELQKGPEKAQTVVVTRDTTTEVKVEVEQATPSAAAFNISLEGNKSTMQFVEGQKSEYKITATSKVPGIKVQLKAKDGLHPDATLTKSNKNADQYILSWTPAYGTTNGKSVVIKDIVLALDVSEAPDQKTRESAEVLVRTKEFQLIVTQGQEVPTEVNVANLPSEVAEGSATAFEVTAKVPGMDPVQGQKAQKTPSLVISWDEVSRTDGSQMLENDGTRHISTTLAKTEYVGNSVWKFTRVFDTKKISVLPALALSGEVIANAAYSKVRLSFQVLSSTGVQSATVLKQLKIVFTKPPEAPRFDFSQMTGQALEVTPGEAAKLSFSVASIDPKAQVKVELPNLKTIPGSPSIECKAKAQTPSRQECTFQWTPPCSATDVSLAVSINASASSEGRNSDVTQGSFKTIRSKKQSAVCAPPPPPAPKPTPKGAQ